MLQIVYRNDAGEKIVHPLTAGKTLTVGRGATVDIRIKNASISRTHAKLIDQGGSWVVQDLGSSNHTFVNGEQIEKSKFGDGDVVRFGDFSVRVQGEAGGSGRRARPSRGDDDAGDDASKGRSSRRARPAADEKASDAAPSRRRRSRGDGDADDEKTSAGRRSKPSGGAAEAESPRSSRRSRAGAGKEAAASPRSRRSAAKEEPAKPASPPKREAPSARAGSGGGVDPAELRKAKQQVSDLEERVRDAKKQIDAQQQRIDELETRESQADGQIKDIREKYDRIRTQYDHTQSLLDRAKDDIVENEETIEAFEREVASLEAQLGQLEATKTADAELLGELKTRVVQKDRRIDELQRELDMMEYDLRNTREELEAIQDSMNHDNIETRKLEREMGLLREVIQEKENIIKEHKIELEELNRDIYDLKMGTGVQDLEASKHDVLEKYFEANRQNEEMREKLRTAEHRVKQIQGALEDAEVSAAESRDIESHPDYQRKLREAERMQRDLEQAQGELERAQAKLEQFGPDAKAKLDADLNFLRRKNQAMQEKLEELEAAADKSADANAELRFAKKKNEALEEKIEKLETDLKSAEKQAKDQDSTGQVSVDTVFRAQAADAVDQVIELQASFKSNLKLLKSFVENADEAAGESKEVKTALSSLLDTLTVLDSDASGMKKELKSLRSLMAPKK